MSRPCGLCNRERSATDAEGQSGVRVDGKWVERFVYREHDATDKAWKATEGLQLAPLVKAILGTTPYAWPHEDSARFVADGIGGTVAWLCEKCVPRTGKRSSSRKRKTVTTK